MSIQLRDMLEEASKNGALPGVIAYNRIDGPGSSLDLPEFQQSLWSMPQMSVDIKAGPEMGWTRRLPRTIGLTIDTGTKIEAHPFDPDLIAVQSMDYGTEVRGKSGAVPPTKENWLLKILDSFGLTGVKFVLRNLRSGTLSSGLGGSATAATGVCILANELGGRPLSQAQLIPMASRMEQYSGVSLTGTQEQSNVIYGGVVDYIWFPWGIPGQPGTGYGESIRTELIRPENYGDLERRMAIFHTGRIHLSTDTNSVWLDALMTPEGYKLHAKNWRLHISFAKACGCADGTRYLIQYRHIVRSARPFVPSICQGQKRFQYLPKLESAHHSLSAPVEGAGFSYTAPIRNPCRRFVPTFKTPTWKSPSR
jgi:Homoserine kinase